MNRPPSFAKRENALHNTCTVQAQGYAHLVLSSKSLIISNLLFTLLHNINTAVGWLNEGRLE
jgi:hypothetical protein